MNSRKSPDLAPTGVCAAALLAAVAASQIRQSKRKISVEENEVGIRKDVVHKLAMPGGQRQRMRHMTTP